MSSAPDPLPPSLSAFPEIGGRTDDLTAAALVTFDADQLRRAMLYAAPQPVVAGQVVVETGDADCDLLLCGTATLESLVTTAGPNERLVFLSYGAGQFAGELNVLTGQTRTLAVRAATDGVIGRISRSSFRS